MGHLTVAEFTGAPTAVGVDDLNIGGNANAQTAELVRVINRASAWLDSIANLGITGTPVPLSAHTTTVTQRVRVGRYGDLRLHPRELVLLTVNALSYGWSAAQLTAVTDLTGVYIDEQDFVVPTWGAGVSFGPQIQMWAPRRGAPLPVRYTYTAGWPNTTLAATANLGAVALTVASTVGMTVGQVLTIVDGPNTETVTVTAVTSPTVVAVTATTVAHTFVPAPQLALGAIAVHAMPEDIKEAAILATAGFIKVRGNDAMVMANTLNVGTPQGDDSTGSADLRLARSIIASSYRVLR